MIYCCVVICNDISWKSVTNTSSQANKRPYLEYVLGSGRSLREGILYSLSVRLSVSLSDRLLVSCRCCRIFRSRWGQPAGRRVRQRPSIAGCRTAADRGAGASRCPAMRHLAATQGLARLREQDLGQVRPWVVFPFLSPIPRSCLQANSVIWFLISSLLVIPFIACYCFLFFWFMCKCVLFSFHLHLSSSSSSSLFYLFVLLCFTGLGTDENKTSVLCGCLTEETMNPQTLLSEKKWMIETFFPLVLSFLQVFPWSGVFVFLYFSYPLIRQDISKNSSRKKGKKPMQCHV